MKFHIVGNIQGSMVNNQLLGYGMVGFHVRAFRDDGIEYGAFGRPRRRHAIVNGKDGNQSTSILPKPVLAAIEAHLQGRTGGYVFEGRDSGLISTRQIQRLLDILSTCP